VGAAPPQYGVFSDEPINALDNFCKAISIFDPGGQNGFLFSPKKLWSFFEGSINIETPKVVVCLKSQHSKKCLFKKVPVNKKSPGGI
jgi:hypothetical protein